MPNTDGVGNDPKVVSGQLSPLVLPISALPSSNTGALHGQTVFPAKANGKDGTASAHLEVAA